MVSVSSEGDSTWNHVKVILEIYPTGVIGMILWASGIYHTWDDSTQLPIFILKKINFWIYCYAPFYCNEPSPNHGFLKLGISIQSERHAFGNRFNHPGFWNLVIQAPKNRESGKCLGAIANSSDQIVSPSSSQKHIDVHLAKILIIWFFT